MLNPIEAVWLLLKSEIKKYFLKMMRIPQGINQRNLAFTEFKLQTLKNTIYNSIDVKIPILCITEIATILEHFS